MTSPSPSTIMVLVFVPLVIWRVYSRIRRMVGRQRLSKIRPWITLTVFPLIVAMLALAGLRHPERLTLLAGGLAVGTMLAVYGMRRTKFEITPQGYYYTPNAHLGIALSSLFIARIAWRFFEIYVLNPDLEHDLQEFGASALTLGVFGLLAGYYVGYAIGLIRWRARASREVS
jgi:hypothetical protein